MIIKFVVALVALPIVLLIRVLKPLVVIRLGRIDASRIGHLSVPVELYLCRRDIAGAQRRTLDVFYFLPFGGSNPQVCNRYLQCQWRDQFVIWQGAYWLDWVNRKLPGYEGNIVPDLGLDRDGLLERTSPHLSFTADEQRTGSAVLERFWPSPNEFVCFLARDGAYLKALSFSPPEGWGYHDYRDSKISSFGAAALSLADRGHNLVRMGAATETECGFRHPQIFDYARSGFRTDFLDVYLCGTCRFFLGDTAGLSSVSMLFRRPIALVNFVPIGCVHNWSPGSIFIPKKLMWRSSIRPMTLREMFESGAAHFGTSAEFECLGVDVVDNTPKEIRQLAEEMDDRLDGTWVESEGDKKKQSQFWRIFQEYEKFDSIHPRIGGAFLGDNTWLLE